MITFNIGRLSDQGLRWQGREANDELAIRDAIAKPRMCSLLLSE